MMSVQIDHSGQASICRGCWDQMHMPIPIRGPLALPFRVCGITRSKMNPNICTICERSFRYVKKQRHVSANATILFADIRGYTPLSERTNAVDLSETISTFQDQCAQAVWAHDGIVNKQMGDGLMAIFNFPITNERHAGAAARSSPSWSRIAVETPRSRWALALAFTRVGSKSASSQPSAAILPRLA